MEALLDIVRPEIESTIERLKAMEFRPDPIAGEHFSRVVSLMSSAYKRHGYILERAILERLRMCPNFEVWEDLSFPAQSAADHFVDATLANPEAVIGTEMGCDDPHRTLQVDAIVFDKATNSIKGYEIKRGAGLHDAGKRRSILRDFLCVQILLKSYARSRGFNPDTSNSHIIFYYGQCSIKKPFSLTAEELDIHFGWPVREHVEAVNEEFRRMLFQILSG